MALIPFPALEIHRVIPAEGTGLRACSIAESGAAANSS